MSVGRTITDRHMFLPLPLLATNLSPPHTYCLRWDCNSLRAPLLFLSPRILIMNTLLLFVLYHVRSMLLCCVVLWVNTINLVQSSRSYLIY